MQSNESLSPSTIFALPPQETETLATREADSPASTLAGGMDVPSAPLHSPEVESFEGPSFEDVPFVDETACEGISPWSEGALDWTESNTAAPQKPATPVTEETRPAPLKDDLDKAAQLGLPSRDNPAAIAVARQANFRRPHVGRIIALTVFVNLLAIAGAGYWYHQRFISNLRGPLVSPHPADAATADATGTASLKSELLGLTTQVAELRQQGEAQKARMEEMDRALADATNTLVAKSTTEPKQPQAAPQSPSLGTDLPPSQSELVLLKERNRLTSYADEAIATGARASYQRLWEALDDPRLADLVHAARAEILRVQNFYLGGSRLERYDIPVASYFPEDAALKDSQLKDDQLIKLLHGKKNPWEVRVKAAFLLGNRRSIEVGDALIETVKRDENLDVVKEATFSFEQLTGYRSRIFDAGAMEAWWKQYRATPTPLPAPATGEADKPNDAKAAAPKSEIKGGETNAGAPKPPSKAKSGGQAKKS